MQNSFFLITRFFCLLAIFLGTNSLAGSDEKPDFAGNWHQFRGPLANGTAPRAKPPIHWSETKNIKWKFELPGTGSSTPIIWMDRIFITCAIKTDKIDESITPPEEQPRNGFFNIKYPNTFYRFEVLCVDRKSGNKIWQRTAIEAVPNEGRHPDNNFASATPTTDGENLYVAFGSQGFYCYSLDGEFKWKRQLGKVKTRNNFGEGASLTVSKERLIIVRDNETKSAITVVNAATGATVWEKERDEPSCWATPLVVQHKNQNQHITNGHTRVRS
ncbi:MAG: PQQ-binding-like beta-propeller repeat protein, partial [Planctomycetota bacterium]|nr:PQQ-binding-like beta-propeller repeat protein [Planctomycetota bacterium]